MDEDRKSDLEDFEDEVNEQNIMNIGMRGNLGMGSINSNEPSCGDMIELKNDTEAEKRISSGPPSAIRKRLKSSDHSDI